MVKLPDTSSYADVDIFVRLKSAKKLDGRHIALVEGAFAACHPPENPTWWTMRRKVRPPVHEYVRHLVFVVLNEKTTSAVLKQLRKLPWAENERYVIKCLLKVYRGRFSHIPLDASVVATLSKSRETLASRVIDAVLEDIRFGLETNPSWMHQRRVATMRLLGELCNQPITSTTVFARSICSYRSVTGWGNGGSGFGEAAAVRAGMSSLAEAAAAAAVAEEEEEEDR